MRCFDKNFFLAFSWVEKNLGLKYLRSAPNRELKYSGNIRKACTTYPFHTFARLMNSLSIHIGFAIFNSNNSLVYSR